MKNDASSGENTALRKLLLDWTIEPTLLPPRFNERVWRRIAESGQYAAPPWTFLRNWIQETFARPAAAVGYVTVLLLAGLIAGSWQAHVISDRASMTLGLRYVQMVDPYQMPQH